MCEGDERLNSVPQPHQKTLSESAKAEAWRKPVVILVHGANTDSRTYRVLAQLLRRAGYTVRTPNMTSSTIFPAVPDWSQDVEIIAGAVRAEVDKANEVFVVAHSYGATVLCQAVEGIPTTTTTSDESSGGGEAREGGIAKLGFIAGIIPGKGGCVYAVSDDVREKDGGGITMKDNLVYIHDAIRRHFNDLPLAEANARAKDVMPMSRFALSSKCTHMPSRSIPTAYLLCEKDQVLSARTQNAMAAALRCNVTGIDNGHAPFAGLRGAEKVAMWIRREAGEVFAKL